MLLGIPSGVAYFGSPGRAKVGDADPLTPYAFVGGVFFQLVDTSPWKLGLPLTQILSLECSGPLMTSLSPNTISVQELSGAGVSYQW